ncbi:MAG: hypothetical protein PHI31_12440 [Desulfuromonadaceae bacterium]|nr:hypothetical protein [Desulfuromonadaceae bacterium]
MSDKDVPFHISAYLTKRADGGPWKVSEGISSRFSGAIVIPSLAEAENLPLTLESLSLNRADLLDQHLILIVVNGRADATGPETVDNIHTLKMLPLWKQQYRLKNLYWVDAASPGYELPHKQGVGLARKIGLDLALRYLDFRDKDPLLICLDADTYVQPDYLTAITQHFSCAAAGGASLPYRHRPAADAAGQSAIDRYELFLRVYVLGLKQAGSPYAFHTVGSAMACRASAYVASGGMNRRLAGEDFYFLQQVHKTSGVLPLTGTVVHPSPRASHRVPFGTGRAVGDILTGGEHKLLFYHPDIFTIVGKWLACVEEHGGKDASLLLNRALLVSPVLHGYLEQAGFYNAWDNLKKNNRGAAPFKAAFHGWFDAFRTMRLIHELSDGGYPRVEPEAAVVPLLESSGHTVPVSVGEQLGLLRRLQGAL